MYIYQWDQQKNSNYEQGFQIIIGVRWFKLARLARFDCDFQFEGT